MKPKTPTKGKAGAQRKPKAQTGTLATRAEAAKALGIARRDLDRAVERGCPPPIDGPRGTKRYNLEAIRQWLAARPQKGNGDGAHAPVSKARAALLTTQNGLAEVKLAVQRGELIPARQAQREAFGCARTVRDNLLNVPDRVASTLAAEPDAGRVHAILTAALTEALLGLAETFKRGPGLDA